MSRDSKWHKMSEWICEVLAYTAMASYEQPITAGDGLRRVLSLIASGIMLERGLQDPQNPETNIFDYLTKQELDLYFVESG